MGTSRGTLPPRHELRNLAQVRKNRYEGLTAGVAKM